jgi:tetratricopeptide (TPR) repeat protein
MKMTNKILIALLMFAAIPFGVMAQDDEVDPTTRKEREHIKAGNALYELQRYAEAEVEYKKALEVNPNSQLGNYDLALSLIQQGGANNEEQENNPLQQATELLNSVAQNSKSADLRSKAFYNLGNLAYVSEKYDVSVELYKNSLRNNPDDDQARDNLRMAQLKLQQQQQNKGKDKNDKKDKDKDKQEDKNNEKKEDKQQQQQQQPQQQQQMSKDNMEQILQAMQNQEKATQEKVKLQQPQTVRKTGNQW